MLSYTVPYIVQLQYSKRRHILQSAAIYNSVYINILHKLIIVLHDLPSMITASKHTVDIKVSDMANIHTTWVHP
jgi:hypothetical protein